MIARLKVLRWLVCGGSLLWAGCSPAWVTAGAVADSASLAIGRYTAFTHAERRRLLAASGCSTAPACEAVLAPFEARQVPVIACVPALAPVLRAVLAAVEERDANACLAALPALQRLAPPCVAAISTAMEARP